MKAKLDNWQATICKVMRLPGSELVVTLVVVLLATWYLVQDDVAVRGAAFPLFAHR